MKILKDTLIIIKKGFSGFCCNQESIIKTWMSNVMNKSSKNETRSFKLVEVCSKFLITEEITNGICNISSMDRIMVRVWEISFRNILQEICCNTWRHIQSLQHTIEGRALELIFLNKIYSNLLMIPMPNSVRCLPLVKSLNFNISKFQLQILVSRYSFQGLYAYDM